MNEINKVVTIFSVTIYTIRVAQNLDDSCMELWMEQSPKTETAVKHRGGPVFLDVPTPANGRRYAPWNPTGADRRVCATPE